MSATPSWHNRIDHLAFAATDLKEGIQYIEELLGVSVQPGGKHPAWGTHNVLLALGPAVFLEIIAPDPEREDAAVPPLFGINQLTEPKLTAWAAKEYRLTERLARLQQAGITFGAQQSGRRQTPDGRILQWHLSDPLTVVGDGVIPFLIDWGQTAHPATAMPQQCRLLDLRIEHPQAQKIMDILRLLDLGEMTVTVAAEPALIATIQCPRGKVVVR